MSAIDKTLRKCPRCRASMLSVIETHDEVGYSGFGQVLIDDNGALIPPTRDFIFGLGGRAPSVELLCGDCGHQWTPRGKPPVSSVRMIDSKQNGIDR